MTNKQQPHRQMGMTRPTRCRHCYHLAPLPFCHRRLLPKTPTRFQPFESKYFSLCCIKSPIPPTPLTRPTPPHPTYSIRFFRFLGNCSLDFCGPDWKRGDFCEHMMTRCKVCGRVWDGNAQCSHDAPDSRVVL